MSVVDAFRRRGRARRLAERYSFPPAEVRSIFDEFGEFGTELLLRFARERELDLKTAREQLRQSVVAFGDAVRCFGVRASEAAASMRAFALAAATPAD